MAGDEAAARGDEAALRLRLLGRASFSLTRPSVNVAVCTVRAVEDDLDPPRGLWADAVLVANDAGVVAVVQERADEGEDRLAVVDLLARDRRARSAFGDDAWVRGWVRRYLAGEEGPA
ncbi:MAG: hypothetical protein K6V73_01460 [Firmicutes bacterium]|nr:hypothetical protein [Bacillota bacterium]